MPAAIAHGARAYILGVSDGVHITTATTFANYFRVVVGAGVGGVARFLWPRSGSHLLMRDVVAVRSGAAVSMPGMMDTVLNLGLNDRTVEARSIVRLRAMSCGAILKRHAPPEWARARHSHSAPVPRARPKRASSVEFL